MNNNLDFEKLRHILEKAEAGKVLDKNEKIYLDIIKVLKEEKDKKVEITEGFKNDLKEELLLKYDNLYKKKGLYHKIILMMNFPLFRFAVSFCFIFSITLGIYSNINFSSTNKFNTTEKVKINSNYLNSDPIKSQDNSKEIAPEIMSTKMENTTEIPSAKSDKKAEMKDDINISSDSAQFGTQSRSGLKFENATNFSADSGVKGLSGNNFSINIISLIKENLVIIGILIFSILASFLITFKRKK
ncbi:MAG: hypothetical protein PHZ26_04960 [Candidatus Gracilibacteria bacterium]|nr:hypothetical protein [Candidatus Gracilibacteria bacterium]MDD2909076.1 hypothetical protein [Candidatus Gracilibacteria bacterium]